MDRGLPSAEAIIAANRREYGESGSQLRWLSPAAARKAHSHRMRLIEALAGSVHFAYKGTKPHLGNLAPGCRCCGAGTWSCLFINGRCNGRCFYCPTPQEDASVPTTNTVTFASPAQYSAYVKSFGFEGVSISGGEPLLTFERTVQYLKALRHRLGDGLHLWLYTNGILADRDKLSALRDAGLNELRFNIGAVDYSLKAVRAAVDVIETVTVEVPAIPEDRPRLQTAIQEMAECGVDFLNLHQLRLTPHNLRHLCKRPYTFLHGERVTVLESELAALELMRFVHRQKLPLAVNYCSFVYKYRFQRAAFRRRLAAVVRKSWEDITEAGCIRRLSIAGDAAELVRQAERLAGPGGPVEAYHLDLAARRLYFRLELMQQGVFETAAVHVEYFDAALHSEVSYRNPFQKVRLTADKFLVVERHRRASLALEPDQIESFADLTAGTAASEAFPAAAWQTIQDCESIPAGLQTYF